jgi:peroxiredoxin
MTDPDFHASSSRGKPLSLSDFKGKVPVVLVFVGALDPQALDLVDLDHHLVDFGRERVQLLVVAHADGADVRAVPFSGLNLPVLADPYDDLVATFGRGGAAAGFAVILDKQGNPVENVALTGGAEGLLARLRELGDSLHA